MTLRSPYYVIDDLPYQDVTRLANRLLDYSIVELPDPLEDGSITLVSRRNIKITLKNPVSKVAAVAQPSVVSP
jgi:hypothetical protein